MLVLNDLDRRTIDFTHVFEDEEVNMTAVLSRPEPPSGISKRDSERRT